jgi:hypothetical protein
MPGCWPGGTVWAGGALTPGVNRLPPVGLMLFSVGAGAGAAVLDGDDVVVGVVVVGVEGAWLPPLPHPAMTAPITTRTVPPARTMRRGLVRLELMINVLSALVVAVTVNPGWLSRCRWRYHLG